MYGLEHFDCVNFIFQNDNLFKLYIYVLMLNLDLCFYYVSNDNNGTVLCIYVSKMCVNKKVLLEKEQMRVIGDEMGG